MFRILRYLNFISLISSGYYLFIFEYLNISDKNIYNEEIVKKEIVEDKKEIIQEKKEEVASPNIKKILIKNNLLRKKLKFYKVILLSLFWKI